MDDMETAGLPVGQGPWPRAGRPRPTTSRSPSTSSESPSKHWPRDARRQRAASTRRPPRHADPRRGRAPPRSPPAGPVIAAGSTGTIPATADLLKAIAGLPQGALVLPGLDQDLDEAAWKAIGETGRRLGRPPAVRPQAAPRPPEDRPRRRRRRSARARAAGLPRPARGARRSRPAETTDAWTALRTGFVEPRALGRIARRRRLPPRPQRARGGARHRHRHPRGARDARRDGGGGHARPRARPPRLGRARPLGPRGRRFRRRPARPHAGGGVRPPPRRGAGRARRAGRGSLPSLKHPFAAFGMDPRDCRKAARVLELAVFRGRRGHGGIAAASRTLAAARGRSRGRAAHATSPACAARSRALRMGAAPQGWRSNIQTILGPRRGRARREAPVIATATSPRGCSSMPLTAAATDDRQETTGSLRRRRAARRWRRCSPASRTDSAARRRPRRAAGLPRHADG